MKKQVLRLGKSALIYGAGRMLTQFIQFLLLPLLTAYLTPADYGVFAVLGLLGLLTQPLFSLGLGAAVGPCYFAGNNAERKETSIWTAFALTLTSSSILSVLALLFAPELSWLAFQSTSYSGLVSLSLWTVALSIPSSILTLRLQFEEKAVLFVTLTTISTLISIGLSIVLVVFLRGGVKGMVMSGLIGQLTNLALFAALTAPGMKFRLNLKMARKLLRLGLPLIPGFAFLFVLQQSNKYILQYFRGLDEVGIYAVGFNLGMFMSVPVAALTTAWYPYFMRFLEQQDEARQVFGRIFTYYIFGFGALSLFFYIAAKPIVMLMVQPAFHEAYRVIGLSASAQFLVGVFSLLLPSAYFAQDVKYISLVQGVAAVVSLGFNLLLIPMFGLYGAAMALMLGNLAMVLLMQAWNMLKQDDYLQVQYEWKRIFKSALIYTSIAAFALWDRELPWLWEFSISIALTVLLLPALYIQLNHVERQAAFEILRRLKPGVSAQAEA